MDWPRVTMLYRGVGGVPTTTVLRVIDYDSYEHSISTSCGFESMQVSFGGSLDDALFWLNQLMASVVVTAPSSAIVWEGYLATVEASLGGQSISRSLERMANRTRVRYVSRYGTSVVSSAYSDTTSRDLYGTKDFAFDMGTAASTEADRVAQMRLGELALPRRRGGIAVGSRDGNTITITLHFAGWYTTLDWLVVGRTDTTTETTTTQVTALLGNSALSGGATGIAATNPFIKINGGLIGASGVSASRFIAPDTTYRAKIEALLGTGNSSNERLVWGVYEDRQFVVTQWAGATPDTITYWRSLRDSVIFNAAWGTVSPWDVRPNAMASVIEVSEPGILSGTVDATNREFISRVTCRLDSGGWSVQLEPDDTTSLDAVLAREITKHNIFRFS